MPRAADAGKTPTDNSDHGDRNDMSLKNILVYVDDSKRAEGTVAAAGTLAREHDAHLTGLAIERPPYIPGFAAIEIPPSAMEIMAKQREAMMAAAKEVFESGVAKVGRAAQSGWTTAKGHALEILALRSRYADVTVLAQTTPEMRGTADEDLVDDLVMTSGRPVLVIPYIGGPDSFNGTVLVGWNASREAARAVADAMPFLRRAGQVEILAVEPNGMGDIPGADIAAHLARHGIEAKANATQGLDIEVGDVLLNRAADIGADLIVMGGYGHSRMRELVLGGATRHILDHMTVPVLLSH